MFIRGLNGDVSKMLFIQRPQTLSAAYASCLEIQNLNFRNIPIQRRDINNTVTAPINQIFVNRREREQSNFRKTSIPISSSQHKNMGYDIPQNGTSNLQPQKPFQAKPPTPMDVNRSIQTKQVNYMNRPHYQNNNLKRKNQIDDSFERHQGIYHIEPTYDAYDQHYSEAQDYEEKVDQAEDEKPELNFMTEASLAFHT